MYIITQTNFGDSITKIVDVKYDLLEATSSFVILIDSLTKDNHTVIFVSKTQAHIVKHNIGWISSSKDIIYVIQMLDYDDPREDTITADEN